MTLFRNLMRRWPIFLALLAGGVAIVVLPIRSSAQAPIEDEGVPPKVRHPLRTTTSGDVKWTVYSGKNGSQWCLDAEATGPGNRPLGSVGGCGLPDNSDPALASILTGQGVEASGALGVAGPKLITLDGYVNVDQTASMHQVSFGVVACDCRVEVQSGSGVLEDRAAGGVFLLSAPGAGSDLPPPLRVIDQSGKVVAERP